MLLVIAVATALGFAPNPLQGRCTLTALHRCRDTSQLVLDSNFRNELKRFTRGSRAWRDTYRRTLYAETLNLLHGPPDEPKRLSNGNYLFTACMAHSCRNKGAAIMTRSGRIVALGMIDYDDEQRGTETVYFPVLAIVVERQTSLTGVAEPLKSWASAQMARENGEFFKIGWMKPAIVIRLPQRMASKSALRRRPGRS